MECLATMYEALCPTSRTACTSVVADASDPGIQEVEAEE